MKRLLLLLAACGSSSPKMPDARVIDAPPDAPPVPHIAYVVNALTWPTTANEARTVGFDLDGNGTIDDQFGATLAALRSQGGIDVQTPTDTAIAHGVSITLADVQAPDLSAPSAGFTLYAGTNPNPAPCADSTDTSCGHHLTGTGSFDVAAMPRDTPIVGPIASSLYVGGPGHLTLPVYVASGTPALITLLAAHVQFTLSPNGLMQGRLGGAIAITDLEAKLYPAMVQGYAATIARDCNMLQSPPSCGCIQGSDGSTLVSFFDANHDCAITVPELEQSSLVMSLFQPDVTVEGQPAMSLGVAFSAVGATYTP